MSPIQTRKYLLSALLLTTMLSHAQEINNNNKTTKNKEVIMAAQKNEDVIRLFYEQTLNQRHLELMENFISDDYTGPQGIKGAEGFRRQIALLIQAFPDIQWHIEDLFGKDDKVAVRWVWHGTST